MALRRVSASFAGCGFLGVFHVGALAAFRRNNVDFVSALGASAGAVVAASAVLNIPDEELLSRFRDVSKDVSALNFGAFNPKFDVSRIFSSAMEDVFPQNAHKVASKRLFISLTEPKTMTNRLISDFSTRNELIDCIVCSCFLPAFSGYQRPQFRGQAFLDGGLSDNLPQRPDKKPTILISPFSGPAHGHAHIAPKDPFTRNPLTITKIGGQKLSLTPENLKRLYNTFVPSEDLDGIYNEGFALTEQFIQSNQFQSMLYL